MQLYFATYDGHTRRIAERIARQLASHGIITTPEDLTAGRPMSLSEGLSQSSTDGTPKSFPRRRESISCRNILKRFQKFKHIGVKREMDACLRRHDLSIGYDSALSEIALAPHEPVILLAALRYGWHLPEADRFLAAFRKARLNNPLVVLSVNLVARKPGKRTATGNPYLRRWLRRRKVTPVFAEAIAGRLDYPRYDLFDRLMIQFIMFITRGPTDPSATIEFTDWGQVDEIAAQIAKFTKTTA